MPADFAYDNNLKSPDAVYIEEDENYWKNRPFDTGGKDYGVVRNGYDFGWFRVLYQIFKNNVSFINLYFKKQKIIPILKNKFLRNNFLTYDCKWKMTTLEYSYLLICVVFIVMQFIIQKNVLYY